MDSPKYKIRQWAVVSRLLLLVLQVIFNLIIPDHQSSDAFRTPLDVETNFMDSIVTFLFGGLTHWDGQHFLHIAEHGYTYENNLAFFPFYPLLMKTLANTLAYPLQLIFSYHSVLMMSGLIVNFLCFVASAEIFYELSRTALRDDKLALRAAAFYCVNPASVFFSALYTESSFALFVFGGMLFYERKHIYVSSICFAFATAIRSNGVLACGFPIYYFMQQVVNKINSNRVKANIAISQILKLLICTFVIAIPFIAYQIYAYKIFCNDSQWSVSEVVKKHGFERNLVMPSSDDRPSWCYDDIPWSYDKIQAKYWDVGLFEYYELKQIPNFLLATPITILVAIGAVKYCLKNRKTVLRLGFDVGDAKSTSIGIDSRIVFVYLVHAVVQLIFAWLFMHVQVVTRFLCASSPFVYWCTAAATDDDIIDSIPNFPKCSRATKLIVIYFLAYFFLGTLMFVNALPFT